MLETNLIVEYISKNGKSNFEEIWTKIYPELSSQFDKIKNENTLKSNIYLSMMQDFRLIMIGNNIWDLKSNYTLAEIEKINNSIFENIESIDESELESDQEIENLDDESIILEDINEDDDFEDDDFESDQLFDLED